MLSIFYKSDWPVDIYVLFFMADTEERILGLPPLITEKTADKQVKEGDTINVTCETDVTQASSIFHLNWYLIESTHNTKKDVAGLERHSLTHCGLTR